MPATNASALTATRSAIDGLLHLERDLVVTASHRGSRPVPGARSPGGRLIMRLVVGHRSALCSSLAWWQRGLAVSASPTFAPPPAEITTVRRRFDRYPPPCTSLAAASPSADLGQSQRVRQPRFAARCRWIPHRWRTGPSLDDAGRIAARRAWGWSIKTANCSAPGRPIIPRCRSGPASRRAEHPQQFVPGGQAQASVHRANREVNHDQRTPDRVRPDPGTRCPWPQRRPCFRPSVVSPALLERASGRLACQLPGVAASCRSLRSTASAKVLNSCCSAGLSAPTLPRRGAPNLAPNR